jgi:hypothetical protein
MVTKYAPAARLWPAASCNVADPLPGAAIEVVEKLAVIPDGRPVADNAIGASKVPDETTFRVKVVLAPVFIVADVALSVRVRLGGA